MADETPPGLLESLADTVSPDHRSEPFHDTDEIPVSHLSNIAAQLPVDVTPIIEATKQYLPELEYPPHTPSSLNNKSLEMYSTPDQEEREPMMRKLNLTTDHEILATTRPIVSPLASPTKEKTTPANFLRDSGTVDTSQLAEQTETLVTESVSEIDKMAEQVKTVVADSTQKAVDQLKESIQKNESFAKVAPDINLEEMAENVETAVTESANGVVDQLKERAENNKYLASMGQGDPVSESESNVPSADAAKDTEMEETYQQGRSLELPLEMHSEKETKSVVAVIDPVNDVRSANAQEDASATSTIYEEISEEEGSDPNLDVNQSELFEEEEVVEDDFEEEELVESDGEEEEEIIDDDEEEIVDDEIVEETVEPEPSIRGAPLPSIPSSVDDQNGDSLSSGGAFLSAIEEGDEHSYQSGDFSSPIVPTSGEQVEGEIPIELPEDFDKVGENYKEELLNVSTDDEVGGPRDSQLLTLPENVTSEEQNSAFNVGDSVVQTEQMEIMVADLDASHDPFTEQEQLPPGWKSHVDPDSGEVYYYNEESGETSWEIPDALDNAQVQSHDDIQAAMNGASNRALLQGGEPMLMGGTMEVIPEDHTAESGSDFFYRDSEREQSLVGTTDYVDLNKEAASNKVVDNDDEERVKELLDENNNNNNPLKSPAVLCLLCAICLILIALIIAIPLALQNRDDDNTDRGITFPTKAPSPEDPVPVPAPAPGPTSAPQPRYELVSGPFEDSSNTGFGKSVSFDSGLLIAGLPSEGQGLVRSFQTNGSDEMLAAGDLLGEQEGSGFGWSVDVSGTIAAIGSPFLFIKDAPTEAGGVYVYEYSESSWSQVGETLRGDEDVFAANEAFGSAVSLALTKDSYRVVVGAPISNLNDFEIGRVYTFEWLIGDGSTWTALESTPLLGERTGDRFGSSVAISKDGTAFIAGGPGGDLHDEPGLVFVYQYVGESSTEAWELVFSIAGTEQNERFGASVAMLSANGDTFAIGAPDYESGSGRIVVYRRGDDGVYKQLGSDIIGERGDRLGEPNVLSGSSSGESVQVVVGTAKGKVVRYDYSALSQSWSMVYEELDPDYSAVTSISVSGANSGSVAIGSEVDGVVSLYKTSQNDEADDPSPQPAAPAAIPVSSPTLSPIVPEVPSAPPAIETSTPVSVPTAPVSTSDSSAPSVPSQTGLPTFDSRLEWSIEGGPFRVEISQSGFGSSIAMSSTLLAVGAPFTLSESGSVHTYTSVNGEWTQSEELYGEETSGGFGLSLDIGGQGLLVGAPFVNSGEGAAYYYESSGGVLTRIGAPLRGDGALDGSFGTSVAVSTNRVAIIGSATYSSDALLGRGAFYIFEYTEAWTLATLEVGFEGGDNLGFAVDIDESGLMVVAGAPGNAAGYASVFEKRNGIWESTLIISGETDGDACGSSVKVLSSTFIAVGAPGYMEGRGRVVVYEKIGDIFEEMTSIVGDEGDAIGSSLQLAGSDTSLIIGKSNGTIVRLDFDGASSEWIQITETVDPGFTEELGALASPPGDPMTFSVGGGQTALVYRIAQQ
ncbi:hypothetical protein FisN_24Lh136 [Fistulifera solaris]|uniref:WW domain-containing protein n=1 Tax=Fistulifera solaris TaxID=1519565 RepID=A0A1Z5K995_FISSO|nr:hypothetical protein FisN_24Lh136 [Fistulifera solaris]|eukprot:GAX22850.1 hypothetical protein FisN_24Lh136 [Fistulifera solaris]